MYATARRLEAMDGFKQPNVQKLTLDVTNEENIQQVVDTIVQKEGRIDVLVNNAGVLCVGMELENLGFALPRIAAVLLTSSHRSSN